jgi:hypothetical protein
LSERRVTTRGSHEWLEQALQIEVATETTVRVKEELVRFVKEESEKAQEGERLLGSSEVIESVFGKFKRLEGNHAKSGITGLLLAIGAMVSETSLKTRLGRLIIMWAQGADLVRPA